MKSIVLSIAAVICVSMPALASELVVTNETAEYASLDLPFTDASNLLKVGEGGKIVSHGRMYFGWTNSVTSAHNTDATNVFTVSDGGQFIYDNGGVDNSSDRFRQGSWAAPKRRSIVTIAGADTVVDWRNANGSFFNGNTSVEISDGATVYMGKSAGTGDHKASARSPIETVMNISGDDTKIFLYGGLYFGTSTASYTSNRVVMTGGSISPLYPSGTGGLVLKVAGGNADDALFDMRGGSIDLWVTNNSNPAVNCTVTVGPGNGEFRMSGGFLYCGDFYVGANQPSGDESSKTHVQRLRMTGGTINCNRLYLGSSNANTSFQRQEAHIDLDGGVLMPRVGAGIQSSSGGYAHGYLTANGGTIKAMANTTLLYSFDTAKLGPKGLTIDSNGKVPTITQSFSNKEGEEGSLIFTGGGTVSFRPASYCTVSKTIVNSGTLTAYSNSVWETTLVITNGATFSLRDSAATSLTLDGLVVPNGILFLKSGDKIHLTTDNIDVLGLKVRFKEAPSSGSSYDFLEFDGDVTSSTKVRNALRFFASYDNVTGNHPEISLSYDEETGKTTANMTFKPNGSALSDETVWNGPSWDASGWSDGVPTSEKVASFSDASAPTAVSVPANAEAGAISVSSGEDYVFSGDSLEISGGSGELRLGVTSGSATFDLPIGLWWQLPMTLAAGTSATFLGPITGGGLVKTGKGALYLGADSLFRYSVSVGGGLNTVASSGAVDNVAKSATLTDDTLVFTNSVDDSEMVVSTPVILNSATSTTNAIVVKADSDVRLKDLMVSSGALVKRGAGRLTVEASETKNTTLYSGFGATLSGNNYRVETTSLVDFAADGTAPAPEDGQYAGFNIAEGEVVIEGDTNRTRQVKLVTGCCIGMNVAGDASAFAQPTLTVDGADVDAYGSGHTTIGAKKCGATGCAVARPVLRVLNGGKITFGNMRFGYGVAAGNTAGAYPTLAATNGTALAVNAIRFEAAGNSNSRGCIVRAKDSTIAVSGTGGSHHGIYLSGVVDADFDNCLFGGSAQTGKLRYQGVSAGTMRFRNGSVFAAYPVNDVARADYAMTLVFDDAEWRWDGGDVTLSYSNTSGEWVLYKAASSGSTNLRDITMEGVGVILKPNAGCTFTTQVPFKGTGGLVSAGEGTVAFSDNALQFTGLLDIRSGTVDLSAANARDALSVRGPGTLKGGTITTLTISETLDNGTLVGAPVLDGVTAEYAVVNFGRDETSPIAESEAENLLVATYSTENPPTVGKWRVAGTGLAHPRAEFTVSGGEVRATVKDNVGMMMIIR